MNIKIYFFVLYGEKENTSQYNERIVLYICKIYQEYHNKTEEVQDISNNYIQTNHKKKIIIFEKAQIKENILKIVI